jgi:exopolysaccharide biosynthesis protein
MRSLHEIEAHGFRNKEGSELGLTVSHGKVSMATNTWVYNAEKNNQNKAGVAIAETNKTGRKPRCKRRQTLRSAYWWGRS